MARPLITHRGQRKPWDSIPRINWDHPLTKGLISYGYDAGTGPIDLVTGGQRTLRNTANPPNMGSRTSKFGQGLRAVTSGGSIVGVATLPGGSVIESLCAATPYSFASGFMPTALGSFAGAHGYLYSLNSATTNTAIVIGVAESLDSNVWFQFGGGAAQATAAGTLKPNTFQTGVGVAISNTVGACYLDGALVLSPSISALVGASGYMPAFNGLRAASQVQSAYVFYGAMWKGRALTAAEARLLHDDPWCFLIYPEDELFDAVVGGAVVVSGTLETTEALDVADFDGSVGPAAITGTLATTEALDVATLAGGPVIAAALATTEALDVVAFAGGPVIAAALAVTEAKDVAVFAGGSVIAATLATTEALDVAAFTSSVGVSGTLATTEALDVAVFAGNVVISAALAAIEAQDVAALAGGPVILAALAVTDAQDVAALAGGPAGLVGSFAVSEISVGITNNAFPSNSAIATPVGNLFVAGLDTALFDGTVGVSGTLVVTEAKDVTSFAGTLPNVITGTLAANEAGVSLTSTTFLANSAINTIIGTLSVVGVDTGVFNGAVGDNGALAVTDAVDTALFNGQVVPIGITGTLTVTEARDTAAFNAVVAGASGTLVVTEARDIAVFNATTVITGQLAVTDVRDTAAFNGKVGVSGTLDAAESTDAALFNGYIGSAGVLTATEARDVAAFAGSVVVSGTLDATEAGDAAAFVGHLLPLVELFGVLAATEDTDTANFNALAELFGVLVATETMDMAHFDARTVEEEAPADFENWKFGKRFDRSLTSRFPWQG